MEIFNIVSMPVSFHDLFHINICRKHFFRVWTRFFPCFGSYIFIVIHRQNASTTISANSLFFMNSVILFYRKRGARIMKPDEKNLSSRDRLIAALETQIKKQEETIKTQEDTIRILKEHNQELTGILDKIFKS